VTETEFRRLRPGDIVRNVGSSTGYIVTSNNGNFVTAVRTVHLTMPSEWTVVRRSMLAEGHANDDGPRSDGGGLLP
jgi:hypothetical protein